MIKDIQNIIDNYKSKIKELEDFNNEHKNYLIKYSESNDIDFGFKRKALFEINKYSLPKISSFDWCGGSKIKDNLLIYEICFTIKFDEYEPMYSNEKIKICGRDCKTAKFTKIFDFKPDLVKLGLERFFSQIVKSLINTEFYYDVNHVEDFSNTEMPDYIKKYLILS